MPLLTVLLLKVVFFRPLLTGLLPKVVFFRPLLTVLLPKIVFFGPMLPKVVFCGPLSTGVLPKVVCGRQGAIAYLWAALQRHTSPLLLSPINQIGLTRECRPFLKFNLVPFSLSFITRQRGMWVGWSLYGSLATGTDWGGPGGSIIQCPSHYQTPPGWVWEKTVWSILGQDGFWSHAETIRDERPEWIGWFERDPSSHG